MRPEGLEPPSSSLEDSCLILLDHGRAVVMAPIKDTMLCSGRGETIRTSGLRVPNATL